MKGRILMTPFIAYNAYDTPAIIIHAIFLEKIKNS